MGATEEGHLSDPPGRPFWIFGTHSWGRGHLSCTREGRGGGPRTPKGGCPRRINVTSISKPGKALVEIVLRDST